MINLPIESVINQTYSNWELIIIDDGSTDNTKEVVDGYDDDRIKYYRQENQERSIARNNGIERATGSWICFLDSDDWYKVNTLGFYQQIIKDNPLINIIKSDFTIVDRSGQELFNTVPYGGDDLGQQTYVIKEYGTLMNFCFSKKAISEARFDNIPPAEDKCFIINVLNEYTFFETGKSIAYQLDHIGRSINKPLEATKAKKVVTVLSKTLFNAKNISRPTASKAVLNWQRNMLHTHWHYYKSIPKYFRYLFRLAPFNLFLWTDSIRIILLTKS